MCGWSIFVVNLLVVFDKWKSPLPVAFLGVISAGIVFAPDMFRSKLPAIAMSPKNTLLLRNKIIMAVYACYFLIALLDPQAVLPWAILLCSQIIAANSFLGEPSDRIYQNEFLEDDQTPTIFRIWITSINSAAKALSVLLPLAMVLFLKSRSIDTLDYIWAYYLLLLLCTWLSTLLIKRTPGIAAKQEPKPMVDFAAAWQECPKYYWATAAIVVSTVSFPNAYLILPLLNEIFDGTRNEVFLELRLLATLVSTVVLGLILLIVRRSPTRLHQLERCNAAMWIFVFSFLQSLCSTGYAFSSSLVALSIFSTVCWIIIECQAIATFIYVQQIKARHSLKEHGYWRIKAIADGGIVVIATLVLSVIGHIFALDAMLFKYVAPIGLCLTVLIAAAAFLHLRRRGLQ